MDLIIKKFKFSKLFKDEDSRFLLTCGVKLSGIYLVAAAFIYYAMWLILSLNSVYFESKNIGFTEELREAFLQNSLGFLYQQFPNIILFFVVLFFGGMYIGKVLLRPFEIIAHYCDSKVEDKNITYNPDIFSDYKLLTRFSEFFFRYIDERMKKKSLKPNTIAPHFSKIHSPPFERVFFFHFMVLVFMLAGFTATFIVFISTEVRSNLIDLSLKMVSIKDPTVGYFMENQSYIYDSVASVAVLIITVSYFVLSFHLYGKISGAIFAFFSTMRAFMKGNFKARVHLIGYGHIRPHGRSFNKYLDHIERECSIDHNDKNNNTEENFNNKNKI
ncbi:MAG: hypothetical protein ACJAS4_000469 [Bacteriovoracaceae bacterium]|jgi:hypothetical protein